MEKFIRIKENTKLIKKYLKKIEQTSLVNNFLSNEFIFKNSIKNNLLVFLYHEIAEDPSEFHKSNNLNVTPKNFISQMKFFKKNFNIISPKQLLSKKFETPAAMITFDDGASGYFNVATDILRELEIPSIHFLNMEPILGGLNWNGLVSYLLKKDDKFKKLNIKNKIDESNINKDTVNQFFLNEDKEKIIAKAFKYHGPWATVDDLKECGKNNLVFFGNHLFNHYNAKNLTTDELIIQFTTNQNNISKFDNFINLFSYPYGQPNVFFDNQTNKIIEKLEAKRIFTANPINYNLNSFVIHRLPMYDNLQTEDQIRKYILLPKYKNYIKKIISV